MLISKLQRRNYRGTVILNTKPKKRVTLRFKLLILLACLVYAGVLFINQGTLLGQLTKEKQALQDQYDQQAMVNSELQNEAQFTNSDAYVEKAAREKLGWVKKGEIKFVEENKVEDGDPAKTGDNPEASSQPENSSQPETSGEPNGGD
jgi:cell division protein FtsB